MLITRHAARDDAITVQYCISSLYLCTIIATIVTVCDVADSRPTVSRIMTETNEGNKAITPVALPTFDTAIYEYIKDVLKGHTVNSN